MADPPDPGWSRICPIYGTDGVLPPHDPLTRVVSHEFPLDQIGKAFETAEWVGRNAGSEVTRAVVTP